MTLKKIFFLLIAIAITISQKDDIIESPPEINDLEKEMIENNVQTGEKKDDQNNEEKEVANRQDSSLEKGGIVETSQFEQEKEQENQEIQVENQQSIKKNEEQLMEEIQTVLNASSSQKEDNKKNENIEQLYEESQKEELEKSQEDVQNHEKKSLKEQRDEIIEQLNSLQNAPGQLQGDQQDIIEQILNLMPDFENFLGNVSTTEPRPADFNEFLGQMEQDEYEEPGSPLSQEMGIELDNIFQEWDFQMQDFNPEVIITFEIEQGQTEILYEEVHANTKMKGLFFIPSFTRKQFVDVTIKTQNDVVVYKKKVIQEGLFSFEIKEAGEYKFIFCNKKSPKKSSITFALDVHNATTGNNINVIMKEHLQHHDINPFQSRIEKAMTVLRDNYLETKLSQMRQEDRFQDLETTQKKMLIFSFVETFGLIVVNLWQVFYIKSILENRRLI